MSESFSAKSYHIHLNLFLQYPYLWNLLSKIRWWTPGVVLTNRGRTTRVKTPRGPGSRCCHLWLRSSTSSSRCRWWLPWTTLFRLFSRLTLILHLLHRRSLATGVLSSWGVTRRRSLTRRCLDIRPQTIGRRRPAVFLLTTWTRRRRLKDNRPQTR